MDAPVVTIEEYLLDTSYNPDVEYIDGEIRTRTGGSWSHGRLQTLLSMWFEQHAVWSVEVAIGVRTRVSATRVRLPDIVVDTGGGWPETLVSPPLIVIEILSLDDSYTETQRLVQDYLNMGIPNIWLLDPATRTARFCEGSAWIERTRLEVAGTEIYLDTDKLFAKLWRDAE